MSCSRILLLFSIIKRCNARHGISQNSLRSFRAATIYDRRTLSLASLLVRDNGRSLCWAAGLPLSTGHSQQPIQQSINGFRLISIHFVLRADVTSLNNKYGVAHMKLWLQFKIYYCHSLIAVAVAHTGLHTMECRSYCAYGVGSLCIYTKMKMKPTYVVREMKLISSNMNMTTTLTEKVKYFCCQ